MGPNRTYAALLRGVNVGGKNRLPMGELRSLCGELGLDDAVTYLQSGNIVFGSDREPEEIVSELERAIAARLGLELAVILRSHDELEAIAAACPFRVDEGRQLHVLFLHALPDPGRAAGLDPGRSPGDAFRLSGRELYLHLPHGSAHTKLTLPYFERTLGLAGTARNWNTLLELLRLTER